MSGVKTLLEEVRLLVEYNWHSEEKNYWEREPDDREEHIFNTIRVINRELELGFEECPDYKRMEDEDEK
jgi:hypothetical protein